MYETIRNELGQTVIKYTDDDGQVFWIPDDPANSDYIKYLTWLEQNSV